ncbi:MAG: pilus motility taxis protein HmpF [Xenococcaceae cyanobacterium]
MLYLAEVQKQSKGFIGGFETKLKLIACQRNDRSWSPLPNNETIGGEDVSNFGEGALIIINLGNNRQIQGQPEAAASQVLSILQSFSRLMDKSKQQEEEIEQWKESLTIQGEEFSRREEEMEARLEQIEQMEKELERLEQERQELEKSKEETTIVREEFERKTKELEGAWQHLQGEQQILEQLKGEVHLNEEQTNKIQASLESLSTSIISADPFNEKFNFVWEAVKNQQVNLDSYWQKLEQNKSQLQQKQAEVNRQEEELKQKQQGLRSSIASLEEKKIQLHVQQNIFNNKQDLIGVFTSFKNTKEELCDRLSRLGISSGNINIESKVNIEALEKMPLGDLQKVVEDLQKDLEKIVRFVNEQEEELTLQCRTVEEIQEKLDRASEYDRIAIEQELSEEKEATNMLDETLVGQRRQLRERQEYFLQHLRIFRRRQGVIDFDNSAPKINLDPILFQLQEQKKNAIQQQQHLEVEIGQIKQSIEQLQQQIQEQEQQQESSKHSLQQMESNWQQEHSSFIRLQAEMQLYETALQPLQDTLGQIRQNLQEFEAAIAQITEKGTTQQQALDDLKQLCSSLGQM